MDNKVDVRHSFERLTSTGAGSSTPSIESECQSIRFYNDNGTETIQLVAGATGGYITIQPYSYSPPFVVDSWAKIKTVFKATFFGASGVLVVIREYHECAP